MKLYLDTHIIIYMLEKAGNINDNIAKMLVDCANSLYTSSASVQEMIYLRQRGKFLVERSKGKGRNKRIKKDIDVVDMVEEMGIKILPVTRKHLKKLEEIPLLGEHRDHNDRVIIAQAISDKATLISSDTEFYLYENYGLDLLFNEK